MLASFHVLLGAGLTAATAFSIGSLSLRRAEARLTRVEFRLFSYVLGSAVLSLGVTALCALQLARKGVFVAVAMAAMLACWRSGAWRLGGRTPDVVPRPWNLLMAVILVPFALLYLTHAMAPEHSPDGATYHLGVVLRYYKAHGFVPMTTNMYGNLSQGMEMLFLFAFAFGRHSAAALVHLSFLFVLPLLMLTWAQRKGYPRAGVGAAVLLFASPVVGIDGSSAYNDVALAAVVFAMFALLEIDGEFAWAAGLLGGFAFALKYTGGLAVGYTLARLRRWRAMLIAAVCAAVIAVPWLVKNSAYTGNPLAPFFNRFFPNPYFYADFDRQYASDLRHFNGVELSNAPYEALVKGNLLGGVLGPVFFLLPVALLALRKPEGRRVLLAAGLFTVPWFFNIGTRFLIPSLPFWSLTIALALADVPALLTVIAVAHAVLSLPPVLELYCHRAAWRLTSELPVRAALRLEDEQTFLFRNSDPYLFARLVEGRVPPEGRVFSFSGIAAEGYTNREVIVGYQSGFGQTMRDMLLMPITPALGRLRRQEFQFPARAVRRIRLFQTASGGDDVWSVSELRLYSGGEELPREAEWRLSANPNPWNVQKAFDNSPVTRWSSHVPLAPGSWIEVDLGAPRRIDSVVLESTADQHQAAPVLELDRQRSGSPTVEGPARPYANLRRAVSDELLRENIRYLLIDDRDFGASDFYDRMPQWGIEIVEQRGPVRLYRIR